MNGDFKKTEELVRDAADKGLFKEYMSSCAYKPYWTKIETKKFSGKIFAA